MLFGNAVYLLCTVVVVLLSYYHWTRRRMYQLAAQIPGPTPFPIIGSAHLFVSIEDVMENVMNIFDTYGSTIKVWIFGILTIGVSEPKYIQTIVNSAYCLDKDKRYNLSKEILGDSLLAAPAKIWKKNRRIINPSFSPKVVATFFDVFVQQSQLMVEILAKEVGEREFDVDKYLEKWSFDIICETAMGTKVEVQTKPTKIVHVISRLSQIVVERALRVWLHPNFIFQRSKRGREFYDCLDLSNKFTENLVKKRYAEFHSNKNNILDEDNERKPFLEHLFALEDQMTFTDLHNEVKGFMAAGSDTTTSATGYILVCLGMHQEIQDKCLEELRDVFGESKRPIILNDLPKLEYLDRVIKETMRLYPPVPAFSRSISKDIPLGKYTIPKGCSAIICVAGTHRDPKIWKDPLKFDPDRFLPEEVAKRHPCSYIPFSAGPRNCIGKQYAMMLIKVIISTVLRTYKINTNMTPETMRFRVEIVSKIIGGFNISIEKR